MSFLGVGAFVCVDAQEQKEKLSHAPSLAFLVYLVENSTPCSQLRQRGRLRRLMLTTARRGCAVESLMART